MLHRLRLLDVLRRVERSDSVRHGLFDLFDFFVAKFAMPVGGIFMCLLMRKFGEREVTRMLTNDGGINLRWFPKVFYFLVSWVIPALILVIFVNELL